MAKKKQIKKPASASPSGVQAVPHLHIPFPAEHFEAIADKAKELQEIPALPPVIVSGCKVACKVISVSTSFWAGTIFVALEATDGQNLLDFLRKDQEVVLHYEK